MSLVIAIDLGGTNIRFALIDEQYKIKKIIKSKTIKNDKHKLLKQIRDAVNTLYRANTNIKAISIGVPGRIDGNDLIEALPNIGIENIDLIGYLNKYFDIPVYLKNDAEMAVIGEAVHGVGKDYKRTYFVTISTGLGGSLSVNKWLSHGSGEIGHTLVRYQDCYYEYEALLSGTGIIKLAMLNGLKYESSKQFFVDVLENKLTAIKVFNDWLDLLIHFFTFIIKTFEPEVIAVTGGVMNNKHLFFEKLQKRCPSSLILPSYFADDSGLIGAAVYAYNINTH